MKDIEKRCYMVSYVNAIWHLFQLLPDRNLTVRKGLSILSMFLLSLFEEVLI